MEEALEIIEGVAVDYVLAQLCRPDARTHIDTLRPAVATQTVVVVLIAVECVALPVKDKAGFARCDAWLSRGDATRPAVEGDQTVERSPSEFPGAKTLTRIEEAVKTAYSIVEFSED